jgi:hypothetical protein
LWPEAEEIVSAGLKTWPGRLFFFLRPGLTSGYKRFPLPPSVDSRLQALRNGGYRKTEGGTRPLGLERRSCSSAGAERVWNTAGGPAFKQLLGELKDQTVRRQL